MRNKFFENEIKFDLPGGIENLRKASEISEREAYIHQYNDLIAFCKGLEKLDAITLRLLSMVVYAWMPTVLDGKHPKITKKIVRILNEARVAKDILNEGDFIIIAAFMNNSYVGASKLLHILNPKIFPIWDSIVATYFGFNRKYQTHNQYKYYKEYFEQVHKAPNNSDLKEILRLSKIIHSGKSVTKVRAVEFYLWLYGRKEKKN